MRADERGLSSLEFQKLQEVPLEAVDASGCAINYQGLDNLCEWGEAGGGGDRPGAARSWWAPDGP